LYIYRAWHPCQERSFSDDKEISDINLQIGHNEFSFTHTNHFIYPSSSEHMQIKFISPAYKSIIKRLAAPRLLPRIWNRILYTFYYLPDQWIVLIALNPQNRSLGWEDFKTILPPPDRDWADPFVIMRDDKYYIFIEEKLYSTNRGRIVCLTFDQKLELLSTQVILERPYHLSYPFLLEHKGQLYMIPESSGNNQIEAYKCVHFPDQWVFEKVLISNIKAVDSTLFYYNEKWWLFANIIESGGTSWDTLCLYSSNDPLSSEWTPHPKNPVVKDIHTARPAGCIQKNNGQFIRPSQDCSVRYGYATNFNHIHLLTEMDYKESVDWIFAPPRNGLIIGAHTWNQAKDLTAIDAILRRRRSWLSRNS
jgi:hypothetical protein